MKRSLLDITQKMFRKPGNVILIPKDLSHPNYWIFEATGWRFVDILREIELRETQDRLRVYINTQNISAKDYIVEQGGTGLLVKFKRDNFEYQLDSQDFIEIKGDIERYA
jgi:hypothetical protein